MSEITKNKGNIKNQEMTREEFERLLMKVKFIAFGITGNIKRDKTKFELRENEKGEELAELTFEVEGKECCISFIVSKEKKQKLLKTSALQLVENFITQHLVNYGRNDYFDDKCPECKQTTLTKELVKNDPNKEAINCNICGWSSSIEEWLE